MKCPYCGNDADRIREIVTEYQRLVKFLINLSKDSMNERDRQFVLDQLDWIELKFFELLTR
jgi:hypothetical protein